MLIYLVLLGLSLVLLTSAQAQLVAYGLKRGTEHPFSSLMQEFVMYLCIGLMAVAHSVPTNVLAVIVPPLLPGWWLGLTYLIQRRSGEDFALYQGSYLDRSLLLLEKETGTPPWIPRLVIFALVLSGSLAAYLL